MSAALKSYTHFAVRGHQANSLQMFATLLDRKMFSAKLLSKHHLDTTLHCPKLLFN